MKAVFVESNSFTRGAEHNHCGLCSSGYDKWTYQYIKMDEKIVCPECLKSRNFPESWDVPSYDEWREMETIADEEYVKLQSA